MPTIQPGDNPREQSRRSIEQLHHFRCMACEKWWSIGDAPAKRQNWFCPWCGVENHFEHVTDAYRDSSVS